MRANGAVEGGAAGFSEGDEVIVLRKSNTQKVYVIGHVTGIEVCTDAHVIIIFDGGYSKKAVLVWSTKRSRVANDIGVVTPCDFDDPDFQAWYEDIREDTTVENLFPLGLQYYWRTWIDVAPAEYNPDGSGSNSIPSLCQEMIPGGIDTYSITPNGTWVARDYLINTYGDINTFSYHIFRRPVSSLQKRGAENFGFRVNQIGHSENQYLGAGRSHYELAETYTFYGPFGVMGTFSPIFTSDFYDVGDPYHTYYDLVNNYFIPYPHMFQGWKGEKVVVNFVVNHFTPCHGSYNYSLGQYMNEVNTPDAESVIQVQAQALYFSGGYKDTDLIPRGNNAGLAAKIADTIRLLLSINSLPANTVPYLIAQVKITQDDIEV